MVPNHFSSLPPLFFAKISRAGVEPTALTVLRSCHNQLDHPDILNFFKGYVFTNDKTLKRNYTYNIFNKRFLVMIKV